MVAQYVESSLLNDACKDTNIRHGFFTRKGGVSNGIYSELNIGAGSDDKPEHVRKNRSRICDALGIAPDQLATLHQHHSNHVIIATEDNRDKRPKADGIVSRTPGLAVGILTADCGPVLLADPKNGVVGAAHAGWRGAIDDVLENTIAAMESIGAERHSITACLGPCISQRNYEVGSEFHAKFLNNDAAFANYFATGEKAGHYQFDLHAFIADKLERSKIHSQILGTCTYENEDRYFSYRRTTHRGEPDYGRQISAIAITR